MPLLFRPLEYAFILSNPSLNQCAQQAQLNLLEEGTRECLEVALREDRIASTSELKITFPGVDKVSMLPGWHFYAGMGQERELFE